MREAKEGLYSMDVLIIGGGQISLEYSKICLSLGHITTLVSRSGCKPASYLDRKFSFINSDVFNLGQGVLDKATHIILAVQPRFTFEIVKYLVDNSTAQLLVEKPVCMTSSELCLIQREEFDKRIHVAFNRRYFESVEVAKNLINDKPILSVEICFTEMKDRMKGSDDEIRLWGMCNTIHLFDMAFYLAGIPDNVQTIRSTIGDVDSYSVTGNLPNGLVSMNAHWGGPGNWGISIATPEEKLLFDPLEKLRVQKLGSFQKDEIRLDPAVNGGFKDGFLSQTIDFLDDSKCKFISYANYQRLILVIEKIFN